MPVFAQIAKKTWNHLILLGSTDKIQIQSRYACYEMKYTVCSETCSSSNSNHFFL